MHTPWGESDYEKKYAEGITFYGTPGHGGVRLSTDRQKEMNERFPHFVNFLRSRMWWEEDADFVVVVLAFHEFFDRQTVERAYAAAERDEYYAKCRQGLWWQSLVAWLKKVA